MDIGFHELENRQMELNYKENLKEESIQGNTMT